MTKDISAKLASLSPAKRALIESRLSQKHKQQNFSSSPATHEEPPDGSLSFSQERLWFLDQFEGPSATYNINRVLKLQGYLNISALKQAIQTIVNRHQSLRTTFHSVEGTPVQIVTENPTVECPVIDLRKLPPLQQDQELQEQLTTAVQRPFDLSRDLMVRTTLFHLGDDDYLLLVMMHHIASDGWSFGVFSQELSQLYASFSRGEPSPLAPLPIQYIDFAIGQRKRLQGQFLDAQLNYWRQQLQEPLPILDLPTDHPRPPLQTFRGARYSVEISHYLTTNLKRLSQESGVTLFITLLAAFNTFLYRYTGQEDILVCSPIAGRNQPEVEGLIGFFVNTLTLRTTLSGNPSFRELLSRVRDVALAAYAHQNMPFEKLVKELQPERDPSRSPLIQVMFVLQNTPKAVLELPGLTLSHYRRDYAVVRRERFSTSKTELDLSLSSYNNAIDDATARCDLTLLLKEEAGRLQGEWEYNTDLFEAKTIERMTINFQVLLEGIVANPHQPISQLPLLTDSQRHQLLVEWNNTQTDYPRDKCIHQLCEEQVKKTPDAVAVVFQEQQLTYRELNNRANQLAHYLQTLGVKPEDLVGICVERSLDMIIGLLAILKVGGAYVPLDPTYPTERIAYMLEDAQVGVLLTQDSLVKEIPLSNTQLICLDSQWQIISQQSSENPVTVVTANHLAYINYTSGSTGKPKGVEVLHRGVIRLLFGIDYVHLDGKQRLLQMAPISFDAATFEIWGALLHGARCILFPETVPTAQTLKQVIHTHNITTLWLTSALFNAIVAEDAEALSGVQQLLTGGEALSVNSVKKALAALPCTQIINGYGPTENTTFTCCYSLPKQLPETDSSISIGRPISNTQVYLLDAYLQPVPIGVIGELYIGGDGLARGYLNRPELTIEKFIPNPFSNQPNTHLYKTGDLARYRADGTIEFVGRIDNQIKLRGFRIEFGEIEAVLTQHLSVQYAVVIATEDQLGHKRLVAYFTSNSEQLITDELRSFLKTKLPDYMIPSAFVKLETLPLTPNGKVDRRALPKSEIEDTLSHNFVPPRNSTEAQLSAIWSSVLGIERVGIHHNFFELGGHSLLATQVISRIRQAFEVELPLRVLFEAPTVAELGDRIETILWAKSTQLSANQIHLEQGEL